MCGVWEVRWRDNMVRMISMKLRYKIRFWIFDVRRKIGGSIARFGLSIMRLDDRFLSVRYVSGMTALKCLEPGQTFVSPGEPYTWVAFGHCPYTKECENYQCFFKRRDCHGYSPWWNPNPDQKTIEHDNTTNNKYGEIIFPSLESSIGTNCIRIVCKNAKGYKK